MKARVSSDVRSGEYRANARAALAEATASQLPQVRDRQRAAASVWLMLARYEERRSAKAHTMAASRGRRDDTSDEVGLEFLRGMGLLGPRSDAR